MANKRKKFQSIGSKLLVLDELKKPENRGKSLSEQASIAAKVLNLDFKPHRTTIRKWYNKESRMQNQQDKSQKKLQNCPNLAKELEKLETKITMDRLKTVKMCRNIKDILNKDTVNVEANLKSVTTFLQEYKNNISSLEQFFYPNEKENSKQ